MEKDGPFWTLGNCHPGAINLVNLQCSILACTIFHFPTTCTCNVNTCPIPVCPPVLRSTYYMMYCTTPGADVNGYSVWVQSYVYWKMGTHQNVAPELDPLNTLTNNRKPWQVVLSYIFSS